MFTNDCQCYCKGTWLISIGYVIELTFYLCCLYLDLGRVSLSFLNRPAKNENQKTESSMMINKIFIEIAKVVLSFSFHFDLVKSSLLQYFAWFLCLMVYQPLQVI